MRSLKKVLFLFIAISAFTVAKSQAQIYVSIRPERPREVVVDRPPAPSPRHVWIAEEWHQEGGRYAYHKGYWAVPPRARAIWIPGHWTHHTSRGYYWVPGYWGRP